MIDFGLGVKLNTLSVHNCEQLRLWRNNRDIWKWCRQNDLITPFQQSQWFNRQDQDPKIKMYGIFDEHKIVGVCGLTDIDMLNRRAEFSLYIGPEHQKQGYAKKALATLLWHGFKNLGLNLIWGESFAGNSAMLLFRSLGFKDEGVRRQFYFRDGKFVDAHLFSITASEWLAD